VLRDWAAAWTRKDASAYLAFYDASFTPPGGKTRAAWESERRQRLSRPGDIRVEVNQPTVELTSPERASLRFTQRYSSTTLNESTSKQLELRLRGTQWKIMSEKTQPN
jgi:ketosteroid isomerase-like protein